MNTKLTALLALLTLPAFAAAPPAKEPAAKPAENTAPAAAKEPVAKPEEKASPTNDKKEVAKTEQTGAPDAGTAAPAAKPKEGKKEVKAKK